MGDDDLHVKVSPDGTSWTDVLHVNATTGEVSMPHSPYVKLHAFFARVSDADTVYDHSDVIDLTVFEDPSSGFVAANNSWVLPASGGYLVSVTVVAKSFTNIRAGINAIGSSGASIILRAISNSTATPTFSATGLYMGWAGDEIWFTAFNATSGYTSSFWTDTRVFTAKVL